MKKKTNKQKQQQKQQKKKKKERKKNSDSCSIRGGWGRTHILVDGRDAYKDLPVFFPHSMTLHLK